MNPTKYFNAMKKKFGSDARTELYYTNEFTLAIAVILSAQATDKHVNTCTPALFAAADTPEKFLTLGLQGLKDFIKSISFFNNKAKNIIALSEKLLGRALPHERDELVKLPGIGRKTANVVSNILWGAPNIGVDTHVFRLSHRFGWAGAADNTPEKVERRLVEIIPPRFHDLANHLMVMHGRYICKALRPKCDDCPVAKICPCKNAAAVV
ncbi:MAG: endonuclease III [Rickettsiales bacterium]|jgi:endonuclease-3|nr:endonuclease III [Rickettsiales bacterium]